MTLKKFIRIINPSLKGEIQESIKGPKLTFAHPNLKIIVIYSIFLIGLGGYSVSNKPHLT